MEEIIKDNEENIEKIQEVIGQTVPEPEQATVGDLLSRDEFRQRFNEFFDMIGNMSKIDGLKIDQSNSFEVMGATATADKLYFYAERYKIMRFLIENNGGWLGDALLIGGFCYAKINVVAYHYTGRGVADRFIDKIRRKPATQEKKSIISKFFDKGKEENEEKAE